MAQSKEARIRLAARRSEAWTLYCKGWSQDRIAQHQDVGQGTVSKDLAAHRAAMKPEELDSIRNRHLEQVRAAYEELSDLRTGTGDAPVDPAVRISALAQQRAYLEREAKLMGLDAPTKTSVDGSLKVNYSLESDDLEGL